MCRRVDIRSRKAYLSDFLQYFGYSAEATSLLERTFDLVAADDEAPRLYEKIRRRYERRPDGKFSRLIEIADEIAARCETDPHVIYLLVLILLSESSRKIYFKRRVSPEIWRGNMLDLKYRADHYLLVSGIYGTDCPGWYKRFFNATRFTFGKLQFETGSLNKGYEKDGILLPPGSQAIFIHIPRTGTSLLPSDVDAACAAASAFFRERYGMKQVVFACHSWILYPENKKILSETSNLYSFISRFDVIDVQEDTEYADVWRLFDTEYKGDADALPQDTSLRRAYAQRIREKKPLGIALGVWIYRG